MPKYNLRMAVVPIDITPGEKAINLARVEKELASLEEGVDLVVLPELFATGFIPAPERAAAESETASGPIVAHVRRWAEKGAYAVCGSFLAHTDTGLANRAFFIEPSGDTAFYDKRHLFTMGGEGRLLRPGYAPMPVVRYRGWNIAFAVCYDLRFPAWLRNRSLAYDALLLPANWPESRAHAWLTLLNARAIENQAYVVGANRLGNEGSDRYPAALTVVFDHMGRAVAERPDSSSVVYATFDAGRLETDRDRFPVWRDADSFRLEI